MGVTVFPQLTAAPTRRALTAAAAPPAPPDPRRIVYNAYHGRFACNPRAIYEELTRRTDGCVHSWTVPEPGAPAFPPGARRIVPGMAGHRADVDAAKYIVSNVEMREQLHKRPGMVFLQTWHGTALKRIGYDGHYVAAHPAEFERDVREYARWDYLISPNPHTSAILRDAFRGFDGEILETGYPRNDALNAPDADATRARVRAALGAQDGQAVVLYAPTWRDDAFYERGPDSFRLPLDVGELAHRLGGDHLFLLRLHHFVVGSPRDADARAVRDVTDHHDIRELYLAADVLVTDYSSAMFDFAITGKPLLFYADDLERYRDEIRGFYFDFEAEAPGPLCRTTGDVVDALGDLAGVRAAYADRYARFRGRFCALDDGHAAARVVERVFTELL